METWRITLIWTLSKSTRNLMSGVQILTSPTPSLSLKLLLTRMWLLKSNALTIMSQVLVLKLSDHIIFSVEETIQFLSQLNSSVHTIWLGIHLISKDVSFYSNLWEFWGVCALCQPWQDGPVKILHQLMEILQCKGKYWNWSRRYSSKNCSKLTKSI